MKINLLVLVVLFAVSGKLNVQIQSKIVDPDFSGYKHIRTRLKIITNFIDRYIYLNKTNLKKFFKVFILGFILVDVSIGKVIIIGINLSKIF